MKPSLNGRGRRRLLTAGDARKKTCIVRQEWLKFCKDVKNWSAEDWKRIIWSIIFNRMENNTFDSDLGKLQKYNVKQTVKHGWWYLDPLVKIEGIKKKGEYIGMLESNLPRFVEISAYPEDGVMF